MGNRYPQALSKKNALDWKEEFPMFCEARKTGSVPVVYLDSAATSLMPQKVIDAIALYESTNRSNIHRGIHRMAEASTELFESARERLASHLGCKPQNIILTHGATEAANIAAQSWAFDNLKAGDKIAVCVDNHHANFVPWQMLAQEKGIQLVFVEINECGTIDIESWKQTLLAKPRLIALTHVSNVTGVEHPAALLCAQAHEIGAKVLLDCAQSFGHIPFDLGVLGVDMALGSCHKAYGPFGLGFLYCTDEVMCNMRPRFGGGGMIERVGRDGFISAKGIAAYEAGTPVVSAAAGLREALVFMESIGVDTIAKHACALSQKTKEGLRLLDGIDLIADGGNASAYQASAFLNAENPHSHCSIVSFSSNRLHPHDIAAYLDTQNIAVRAGHHCAMPLHTAFGIGASVRVSFGIYNNEHDVEAFLEALYTMVKEKRHATSYRHRR